MLQISVRKVSNIIFRDANNGFVRINDSQNKGCPSPTSERAEMELGGSKEEVMKASLLALR